MNRTDLINAILELKPQAIKLGFDFPSQDPAEATTAELQSFIAELKDFITARA
jgi:hypothetical protein